MTLLETLQNKREQVLEAAAKHGRSEAEALDKEIQVQLAKVRFEV